MTYPLSQVLPEYEQAFAQCSVQESVKSVVTVVVDRMIQLRNYYETVEKVTGVPWWFSGILHYKEWDQQEPERFARQVAEVLLSKNYQNAKTRTLEAYLWGFDLWNGFKDGVGTASSWLWSGTTVFDAETAVIGAAALVRHLSDEGLIDMLGAQAGPQLVVGAHTIFKAKLMQSAVLSPTDKLSVKAGTRLSIVADEPAAADHVKVVLPDGVLLGQDDRLEWYVYKGHIKIVGTERDNKPQESPTAPAVAIASADRGAPITVPTLGTVYLGEAIIHGGHFSWADATKDGARIPVDEAVVDNILKMAQVMEEVRDLVDNKSITVTSWYRDPDTNQAVGGASRSRHLVGDAVDFIVDGMAPSAVHQRLEPWWGDRGGMASASSFTHIDARGYKARWSYGF